VPTRAITHSRVRAAETGSLELEKCQIITFAAIAHSPETPSLYHTTPPSPLYNHITMASRTATRALRSSLRQAAKAPAVQQRTFVSAINAASRPALAQAPKAANAFVQQRGVKTVDFAGHKEDVYGKH
jgi:hypothetical protein